MPLPAGEASGVIAKTARECGNASALIKERLGDDVPVTLVTGGSANLPRGVSILPSYLSKGIEFDAVLVWDASKGRYGREQDRKLLYTVCTRALHVLHVYCLGEPSPFLAASGGPARTTDAASIGRGAASAAADTLSAADTPSSAAIPTSAEANP